MPGHLPSRTATALLLVAALAACGTIRPGNTRAGAPEGFVITSEDITRSRATNAWQAVRMSGSPLLIRENSRSDDARTSIRGASSLLLSNQVLVVVDGTHLDGWTFLRDLPASSIEYIQILTGPAGTLRYGTPGGNGVIVVKTWVPAT